MSRFFSKRYSALEPYTPGEQPKDRKFIKLNTNESPFPPSPHAVQYAAEAAEGLQLYCDPECTRLSESFARLCGVQTDEVIMSNGSDEILEFAFMAFCDEAHPALFPDITYGFYPVFANLLRIPYTEIPLRDDLTVDIDDYIGRKGTVFLANPNAPTGIALPPEEIERLLKSDPNRIVVVDEAYIDFGNHSCVPLICKYDNLFVTRTFSKSRSLAGARLGAGIASAELIRDIRTLKYSTNPYNVNAMTAAAGYGAIEDEAYTQACCKTIIENREWTAKELAKLGFAMTPSTANFVFARHDKIGGAELYQKLREKGILVRHFSLPRIEDYNRITVGTAEQMQALVAAMEEILS